MVSVCEELIAKIIQHEMYKQKENRKKKDGAALPTPIVSNVFKDDKEYPSMKKSRVKKKKKKKEVNSKVTKARNDDGLERTKISIVRPLRCSLCPSQFKLACSLRVHMGLHDGTISPEPPFLCCVCGKTFNDIRHLYSHCRIHWDVRQHKCDICGSSFLYLHDLTVHRRKHTGYRPFTCSVCGDSFSSSANRMVHMRIHTGHRPYVCRECGRSFNQSHVLIEHIRVHTGHKPYECGLCEWTFVSSSSLRKHSLRKHVI